MIGRKTKTETIIGLYIGTLSVVWWKLNRTEDFIVTLIVYRYLCKRFTLVNILPSLFSLTELYEIQGSMYYLLSQKEF